MSAPAGYLGAIRDMFPEEQSTTEPDPWCGATGECSYGCEQYVCELLAGHEGDHSATVEWTYDHRPKPEPPAPPRGNGPLGLLGVAAMTSHRLLENLERLQGRRR